MKRSRHATCQSGTWKALDRIPAFDCCGFLGAGNEFTHAVRNRALTCKEQFRESFVIAVSLRLSHGFPPRFQFPLTAWKLAITPDTLLLAPVWPSKTVPTGLRAIPGRWCSMTDPPPEANDVAWRGARMHHRGPQLQFSPPIARRWLASRIKPMLLEPAKSVAAREVSAQG